MQGSKIGLKQHGLRQEFLIYVRRKTRAEAFSGCTIALALASIGLYAFIAHFVNQRVREIGVRIAVGATPNDIFKFILKLGLAPVCSGLIIGLAASAVVDRVLSSELVHVSPTDPVTFIFAVAALVLSAALGCWIPARRALCVDPTVALRQE